MQNKINKTVNLGDCIPTRLYFLTNILEKEGKWVRLKKSNCIINLPKVRLAKLGIKSHRRVRPLHCRFKALRRGLA